MELEVIVFIVIGIILAYVGYRMFFVKSKQESETVLYDIINAPYKVEPPESAATGLIQGAAAGVNVHASDAKQETKAPELKVEAGGKQSAKPRSRKPRNPRPKTAKTDTTAAVKPAAKAPAKPRAKVAAKPTPK
jgi:hypothetical protein